MKTPEIKIVNEVNPVTLAIESNIITTAVDEASMWRIKKAIMEKFQHKQDVVFDVITINLN